MAAIFDRIDEISDLFLSVAFADGVPDASELAYVTQVLSDLLCVEELPPALRERIRTFDPTSCALDAALLQLGERPPMAPRRLLELSTLVALSDGSLSDAERGLIVRCGSALGLDVQGFLDRMLSEDAARESFVEKARIPL